jgi:LysR family transcriptional regulator, benzoate and cis,cis-muconate-responsive activator of ben and cat genes
MLFQYSIGILTMPSRYYGFDLRQLVSFAEVARLKSYRYAAARLNIAQPAVSRQIQALEETLGVALFDRNNRRVILTRAGEWLNHELSTILSRLDRVEVIKQNVSTDPSGCLLRIGDAGGATAEILAPALQILRKRYPKIKTSFHQNNSCGFFQDLLGARIDCAFPMLPSDDQDLVSHLVLTHRIGVVLPADHRLSQHKTISFSQLKHENWILFPRSANPVLYDEIISCCHQAGFSPQIVDEVSPRQRAVALVACGAGITTMTEQRKHLCLEGTLFRLLRSPQSTIGCFVCARKDPSHPLVPEFLSICLEVSQSIRTKAQEQFYKGPTKSVPLRLRRGR